MGHHHQMGRRLTAVLLLHATQGRQRIHWVPLVGSWLYTAIGSCGPTILFQSTQARARTCWSTDPPHFSQSLDVPDAFFGCVVNLLLCGEPTNAKPDGTKTNLSDASFMGNKQFLLIFDWGGGLVVWRQAGKQTHLGLIVLQLSSLFKSCGTLSLWLCPSQFIKH